MTHTAHRVRTGCLSALALLESRLTAIEAIDPALNCFTEVFADRARRAAAAIDARVAAGQDPGPLAGIPFGVKDNYDVAGRVTAAGSAINRALPPAAQDAAVIQRLTGAGAVLVGTLNMDEFGHGFTTENHLHGPARNPLDHKRSAGGSSGGSAAAVAAGLIDFALGSDAGGDIGIPASFCGVFGLKPTFGRLPRTGTFPFAHDLDHLGALASGAADLAIAYDAMQGHDAADGACADRPVEPAHPCLAEPFAGRVGILGEWFDQMADTQGHAAVAQVAQALGSHDTITLAGAAQARAAALILAAAASGSLHFEALAARADAFDPAVRDRLLAGALIPAHLVLRAQRHRAAFRNQCREAFRRHDLLIAAATPCSAIELGQAVIHVGGADLPARANLGLLAQPLTFVGLPIVTVPVRSPEEDCGAMPIAVQIIAPPWREGLALQAAAHLERAGIARGPAEPA